MCCYAACWGPTKAHGVYDVTRRVANLEPDLLSSWWVETFDASTASPLFVRITPLGNTHHYYFSFFGYVAKLPFECEVHAILP